MIWFETERLIDWGDCDAAGIVFFPNFFAWIDGHFHQFTASLGFDQRSLIEEYGLLGTPLKDTRCTFHAPASYGERITIASQLTKIGTSSLTSAYRFTREGTLLAEARETRVMARQTADGVAKVTIPDPIRAALAAHLAPDAA